jgi:hypothetical protein
MTANTPGYNSRISIWFATDRRGRPVAYMWSALAGRAIRIGYADAEIMRAADTADVLCCHPARPHTCGK